MNSLAQMQNADFGSNTFIQFNHHHYLVHDILLFVYPDFINKIFVLNKMCQQNFMHWIRKKCEVERNEKRKKTTWIFLYINVANFQVFCWNILLRAKILFMKCIYYGAGVWRPSQNNSSFHPLKKTHWTLWWSKIQNKY